LISQDGPGLNVVRGSVRRQTAAVESGVTYADLDAETRAAYLRPTKAEGWDLGLLQLFRAGFGRFQGDGKRLRALLPRLVTSGVKVLVFVGGEDTTTPPELAEGFVQVMVRSGFTRGKDLTYVAMPEASHLPMEQTEGDVRETFEKIVVEKVLEVKEIP
jgi:pimeloyl-ACP methyl ester carboxylesterase